jgi:hypothetical protein
MFDVGCVFGCVWEGAVSKLPKGSELKPLLELAKGSVEAELELVKGSEEKDPNGSVEL